MTDFKKMVIGTIFDTAFLSIILFAAWDFGPPLWEAKTLKFVVILAPTWVFWSAAKTVLDRKQ